MKGHFSSRPYSFLWPSLRERLLIRILWRTSMPQKSSLSFLPIKTHWWDSKEWRDLSPTFSKKLFKCANDSHLEITISNLASRSDWRNKVSYFFLPPLGERESTLSTVFLVMVLVKLFFVLMSKVKIGKEKMYWNLATKNLSFHKYLSFELYVIIRSRF